MTWKPYIYIYNILIYNINTIFILDGFNGFAFIAPCPMVIAAVWTSEPEMPEINLRTY